MKRIIFLLVIISFPSCSKKEDNSTASISITNSEWYLTRTIYGGEMVNLKITVNWNVDKSIFIEKPVALTKVSRIKLTTLCRS